MKILIVQGTAAGGVRVHVGQLANLLAQNGHEVAVAGPEDSIPPRLDGTITTETIHISSRPDLNEQRTIKRLETLMVGCDVVHAHGLRAGALCGLALPKSGNSPKLIVTLHNQISSSLVSGTIGRFLLKRITKRAFMVLGVSKDVLDAAKKYGASRVELAKIPFVPPVRSGASAEAIREGLGVRASECLIVTIARLAPQKGLPLLLGAARGLKQTGTPFCWCIAGDGPLEDEVRDGIDTDALPVKLLGKRNDAADLMFAADVVVNTSYWEGQSIALQEALFLGKAIVATDAGGTGATIGDGGLLVPLDAERISEAVASVLGDGALRTQLESRASTRAQSLATEDDLLEQVEWIYHDAS